MEKNLKLRGLVVTYFGTIANLAKAMGWSYSRLYRIIVGLQEPTAGDIRELSQYLHLTDAKDIVSAFSLS